MLAEKNPVKPLVLRTPDKLLTLTWESGRLTLDCGDGQRLTFAGAGPQPRTDAIRNLPVLLRACHDGDGGVMVWEQSQASGPIDRLWGEIRLSSSGLRMQASYTARSPHVLGGWDLLPKGSDSTFGSIENLWNQPAETRNFISLPLNEPGQTTTGGANRIWAPHVSAICFCGTTHRVLLGVPEISSAFGLDFQNDGKGGCEATLDFGGQHGLPVRSGERVDSPVVLWQVKQGATSLHTLADFFAAFRCDAAPPAPLAAHWRKPWYCTWADQYSISVNRRMNDHGRLGLLDEAFVHQAVNRIKTERLPIGTIILDEGWQTRRGDWDVDTRKFPDFRRLVDTLHDQGLSVVLWWAPLCFDAAAEMTRQEWMFCKGVDVKGQRRIDYSSPRVQREHLEPLLRRFFSSDSGCWNLDGVKIDFLADRHHPGAHAADENWHGQERGLLNFYRLVWESAHLHKPDACLYGTAQHPAFAPYQNLFGLEETYTADCHWLHSRAQLQSALMPKTAVTAHFNYFCEAAAPFMQQCGSTGIIPQIPPLFEDLVGFHPDSRYFETLRESMSAYGEG